MKAFGTVITAIDGVLGAYREYRGPKVFAPDRRSALDFLRDAGLGYVNIVEEGDEEISEDDVMKVMAVDNICAN